MSDGSNATAVAAEAMETVEPLETAVVAAAANDTEEVQGGYFYQVEQLTFLWVLFALIVLGNSTVLLALALSKGRKSRMNFFIKNLAAADLLVGLVSVLTDIIWKITISWEAGLVACKAIRFSQALVTYASTYVLVALSIDRYDAITHPMNFSGSWRRARGLVAAAWILSAVFSAPILHFYETTETEEYGTQCWIDFDATWKWRLYMTLVSITLFVIPALIISACYIVIVVTIWSKGNKDIVSAPDSSHCHSCQLLLKKGDNNNGNSGGGGGGVSSLLSLRQTRRHRHHHHHHHHHQSSSPSSSAESRRASSRGLIPKAKVKTVKMTFVIIFVFILCWSPYIVFDLLQVYGCIPTDATSQAVATFIQSLAPLNSAANPLIYCLFSTNAGQNLCSFFGCCGESTDRSRQNGKRRQRGLLASHNTAQTTKSTSLDSAAAGHHGKRAAAATTSSSAAKAAMSLTWAPLPPASHADDKKANSKSKSSTASSTAAAAAEASSFAATTTVAQVEPLLARAEQR